MKTYTLETSQLDWLEVIEVKRAEEPYVRLRFCPYFYSDERLENIRNRK